MNEPPVVDAFPFILLAKKKGILPLAHPALDKLLQVGLYLDRQLIDNTLTLVDE